MRLRKALDSSDLLNTIETVREHYHSDLELREIVSFHLEVGKLTSEQLS